MKKQAAAGLITAGGIAQSLVPRLPHLLSSIGPVVSSSFRVARRIANSLRSGRAAGDFSALDPCELIWIAVPDSALDRVLRDLGSQSRPERKRIILCDSLRDSASVPPLYGARIATLNAIDTDARTLVAEGHPAALADLRRLAASEKRKLIEIRPSSKALYLAGSQLAGDLLLPWIAAAVESLRDAGFSRAEAMRVVEAIGAGALRRYGKAGAKAWSGIVSHDLAGAAPRLEKVYAAGLRNARAYFEGK